jgi:hypothetical protein
LIKERLGMDPRALDQFNPITLWLTSKSAKITQSEDLLEDQESQFAVVQVCVWMLLENYSNWYMPNQGNTQSQTSMMSHNSEGIRSSKEADLSLFEGIITYLNLKYDKLFPSKISLIRDISKLAGRLSKLNWKKSPNYEQAINIMIENMYSDTNYEASGTLMLYFTEMMGEMQARRNDETTNEIYYITEIFVTAFQCF